MTSTEVMSKICDRLIDRTMLESAGNVSLKLKGVVGYKGRQNDVIYCHPLERSEQTTAVIYFGGDIQASLELCFIKRRKTGLRGSLRIFCFIDPLCWFFLDASKRYQV